MYPAVILFLALTSLFLPAISRAQEVLFPGSVYPTSSYDYIVKVGDVNGDGKPDIVIANRYESTVTVLPGNGNGTFGAKAEYAVGSFGTQPRSIAIGDLNGDGKADILTANQGSNTVSVLLNNGNGTFAAKVDYIVGVNPVSVAVGDFNGDGKLDIVTANSGNYQSATQDYDGNTVSVLYGNGNGTFAAKVDYTVGVAPFSVVVGDLNGDGKADIATSSHYGSAVSVLLNNGAGGFAAKVDYAVGLQPRSIAIGDFNGDNKPDLVTSNEGASSVSVLLNNGNGTFAAKTDYAAGTDILFALVADVNGDGKADIIGVSAGVSVLSGNGDGTFAPGVRIGLDYRASLAAIGDFNGDGKADFVISTSGGSVGSPSIGILLNKGNGTFPARADYGVNHQPYSVATGDFNRDGKPDLVVANDGGYTISVLRNYGNGTFASGTDYSTASHPVAVAVGDLNGDGRPDIVIANYFISVMLGNGDGTFAARVDYTQGAYFSSVTLGDLNGDGRPDIVAVNSFGSILVLMNNGNGTFAAGVSYPVGSGPGSAAIADFNGDGKPDIVTANAGSNTISVLFNNGNGTFAAKVDYPTGNLPQALTVGDFNGDGRPDIVTANLGNYQSPSSLQTYDGKTVSVLLNKGNGTFAPKVDYTVGPGPFSVAVGDINGDGKADIVTADVGVSYSSYDGSYSGSAVSVLLGRGDGTFAAGQDYTVGYAPRSVVLADFNGDGKLDIATANSGASSASVLLNSAERSAVSGLLTLEGIASIAPAQSLTFTFRTPGYDDFASTQNVLPTGNFAVNLPKRSGVLHIKGSKYLAANVNVNATAGNVSGVAALLPAGDANSDNSIDPTDFGIFVSAYNTSANVPGGGYDARADFNLDGFVDPTDFGLFVGNYNTVGDL